MYRYATDYTSSLLEDFSSSPMIHNVQENNLSPKCRQSVIIKLGKRSNAVSANMLGGIISSCSLLEVSSSTQFLNVGPQRGLRSSKVTSNGTEWNQRRLRRIVTLSKHTQGGSEIIATSSIEDASTCMDTLGLGRKPLWMSFSLFFWPGHFASSSCAVRGTRQSSLDFCLLNFVQ